MDQVAPPETTTPPDELQTIARRIKSLDRSEIKAWLERGRLLDRARGLQTPGDFGRWLKRNAIPRRTAYAAIAAWSTFGTCAESARFTKEAMAILSQSDLATAAAITLAGEGQRITGKKARELVTAALSQNGTPRTHRHELRASKTTRDTLVFITADATVTIKMNDDRSASKSDLLSALLDVQRQLRERLAA